MITSSHNTKLKLTRSLLAHVKDRREANSFVVEGVRLVQEALAADIPFRFVLHSEELSTRGKELLKDLKKSRIEIDSVASHLINAMSDTNNSQGILAVLEHKIKKTLPEQLDFVLIADQIRDPGNLGTLLRSAWAAGVQVVFLPPETTDAFAPKVVRAGMGAHFHVPILRLDWMEIRRQTRGLLVLLADMDGVSCWETNLKEPLALIVGSEAEGGSSSARQLATATISIPMPGGSESLNAGMAGSMLLFEVVRQRGHVSLHQQG